MRPLKKAIVLFTAVCLVLAMLAGCSGGNPGSTSSAAAGGGGSITQPAGETDTTTELSYWCMLQVEVANYYKNLAETPLYQQLFEDTGITVKFTHPSGDEDAAKEQFNLMIAAGEYPDIIEWDWLKLYPGGPEKAISDNVILKLNDVIDEHAPNLKALLADNPDGDKEIKTDEGTYYAFPFLCLADRLLMWAGPVVRQDWLDDLSLDEPETIDDWYEMLTAFKNEKGATAPFVTRGNGMTDLKLTKVFVGAYGVDPSFYVDGDQVKFGPIEDGYREFLATFSQWYAEGLIDPDFVANDNNTFVAKMTTDQAGAFSNSLGGSMGNLLGIMAEQDTDFDLVGVKYPVLEAGTLSEFGQKDNRYNGEGSAAITTRCEDVAAAAKFLDYGYGEAGHMLFNFGIEGETYTLEGDYPKYSDMVMNNPDGLSMVKVLVQYSRAVYNGPFSTDARYHEQYLSLPQQNDALEKWKQSDFTHGMPSLTFTPDESEAISKVLTEIETYVDEMTLRFIMGQQSLDTFAEYVDNVKGMGIETVLQNYQQSYERFTNR